jgi:Co/Zn/Cd efflux system component
VENLQRTDAALRSTIALVALLNLGYFGVEFAVALAIGSESLFADSIDFLEDATVNDGARWSAPFDAPGCLGTGPQPTERRDRALRE